LIGTDSFGNKYYENLGEELPRESHGCVDTCQTKESADMRNDSPHAMGGLQQ